MKPEVKFLLIVLAIIVVVSVMIAGTSAENLEGIEEYSGLEIGFGLLFLSAFIWVPLILVLFAPSMTR